MDQFDLKKRRLIDANLIIIFGRWFYVGAIGTTGLISKLFGGPNANFSPLLMLLMFGSCYGLNFLYFLYFKKYSKKSIAGMRAISFTGMIIDIFIITLAVYFAGGIISISFLYYFYVLIASAFIYSTWGVTLIATIVSAAYSGLIILEYYKIIPFLSRYNINFESYVAFNKVSVITNVFAVVSSFYIAGYFCGLIAKNLRKKEEEIIEERDKEKAIISNLSDGLIYIDRKNRIDTINNKAKNILGVKNGEVIGKKIKELKNGKFKPLREIIESNGQNIEINLSNIKDIYIKVSSVQVRKDGQELIGTAKIIHDVSREKYIDKVKSEFITIASHQLRTPLSAIKGALSLLVSGDYGEINREQKTMIQQSFDYTEKLIKIVDDMLSVSSAEEGKYRYEFKKTEIRPFVEGIFERFKDEAKNRKIEIVFDIENELPFVSLDREKFKLVLNSLIENALIYNKENGSIMVTFAQKEGKLLISVKDTGIGMSKKTQEKIFTKFFRADNALLKYTEGNGLDLYVVKNIIENHQGDIWFESELDQGTIFYIEIPFNQSGIINT